jgi:DNA-binding NarL/FixJ family response regulator
VRTLVAGPGYGKTVLLEQWAASNPDRRFGWYRARRSAADVAVVARGIQESVSSIVPEAGRRMLERLSITENPEREAVLLGEMLAGDLAAWPEEAWVAVDDYQNLSVSEGSERFVHTVLQQSDVQLVLASRSRPLWVDAKALLYGEVLEVTQSMLAMTVEEAERVLEGSKLDISSGLLALADGWPAVIGLAGMAPDVTEIDADAPETLFAFFAEELYRGLDPVVAEALGILAALPSLDRELAGALLGAERAARVYDDAIALGILEERDGRGEIHPLASAFLRRQIELGLVSGVDTTLRNAFGLYRRRKDWDSAIEIAAASGSGEDLSSLLLDALDELLAASRLSMLERSIEIAVTADIDAHVLKLAQASLALRHGRTLQAQALAEDAAQVYAGRTAVRALLVAGAAAHAGSRENDALRLFETAESIASDEVSSKEAKWGRLMSATALELPEAAEILEALTKSESARLSPTEIVRGADKRVALGLRFGSVPDLTPSFQVAELLPEVANPVIRNSFRATFSCALNLASRYEEALHIATAMLDETTELRIEFASPYAQLMRSAALAGLRRFDEAHTALEAAERSARQCADAFALQAAYAAGVRLLLQERRIAEACGREPPDVTRALPGMRGEVLASRGLALACLGRIRDALDVAAVATSTKAIEASVLVRAIAAVVAVKRRDSDMFQRLSDLVTHAYKTGGVDLVVTTYRASPDVLDALLSKPDAAEIAVYVVGRAGDHELVKSLGRDLADSLDPIRALSQREREVYELVRNGLPTSEIAKMLFISEATVKAHVHHVFDKLGMRSRTALVLDAAVRGRRQATPRRASGSQLDSPSVSSEDGTPGRNAGPDAVR